MNVNRLTEEKMYKAVLFASDGEYVVDYHDSESIKAVEVKLQHQGSRWYFYPIEFVIPDNNSNITHNRIVSTPDDLTFLKGLSVKTVKTWIQSNQNFIEDLLQY
jgi:hypothetical protein